MIIDPEMDEYLHPEWMAGPCDGCNRAGTAYCTGCMFNPREE